MENLKTKTLNLTVHGVLMNNGVNYLGFYATKMQANNIIVIFYCNVQEQYVQGLPYNYEPRAFQGS